jgi:hypothetical protein
MYNPAGRSATGLTRSRAAATDRTRSLVLGRGSGGRAGEASGRRPPAGHTLGRSIGIPIPHTEEAARSVAWSDEGSLGLDGVENQVVVRAQGRVPVTARGRARRLTDLPEPIPGRIRTHHADKPSP